MSAIFHQFITYITNIALYLSATTLSDRMSSITYSKLSSFALLHVILKKHNGLSKCGRIEIGVDDEKEAVLNCARTGYGDYVYRMRVYSRIR